MELALEVAINAGIDVPIGCVVLYQDLIIAQGHNEVEVRKDPTAHAEILCIQRASKFLGRQLVGEALLPVQRLCKLW